MPSFEVGNSLMIKKAILISALLAAGGGGYYWMTQPQDNQATAEQRRGNAAMQLRSGMTGSRWGRGAAPVSALQVEAMTATTDWHHPTMSLLARVDAKRRETVMAPLNARVEHIHVRPGQAVTAGTELLQLQADSLRWSLRQQGASIEAQEAAIRIAARQHEAHQQELEQSRANYQRERNLRQQGFGNDAAVQAVADALRNAELRVSIYEDESLARASQLEQARIQLEQAQAQLDDLTPRAPFDANVVNVSIAPSVQVTANQALVELVDPGSLYASTQIPIAAYRQLRDSEILAYAQVAGQRWSLSLLNLAATTQAGSVALELALPAEMPVLINETIELSLALPQVEAYAVPQDAIYYGDQLYTIEEGRLLANTISILGYQERDNQQWALVAGAELNGEINVLTTRLSQPTNGTPVAIVDPNGEATEVQMGQVDQ